MELVLDDLYRYRGNHPRPTLYRLRMWGAPGRTTVALATELPENRGLPINEVDADLEPDDGSVHRYDVGLNGFVWRLSPGDPHDFLFFGHRPGSARRSPLSGLLPRWCGGGGASAPAADRERFFFRFGMFASGCALCRAAEELDGRVPSGEARRVIGRLIAPASLDLGLARSHPRLLDRRGGRGRR